MSRLIWCTYKGQPQGRLLFEIGVAGNTAYCLDTDTLNPSDVTMLRQGAHQLDRLEMADKFDWVKSKCPGAAIKSFMVSEIMVLKVYPIKSL